MKSKVVQIQSDFENQQPPFDDVTFPEERLLEEMPHNSMEERAILVSMFATFDYNRNANQLVDNITELYEQYGWWFDAERLVDESSERAVEMALKNIGFRYPSRDAHAWFTNCEILQEKYNGKWTELLLSVGADAPSLVERLTEDGFLCLKGEKIAPMYARIISDDVVPLSNVWDLNIAVDTHIRKLSKDLFGDDEMSDDQIRAEWRGLAIEADISRHVVDGALWQIGNNWDEWGKDYWEEL